MSFVVKHLVSDGGGVRKITKKTYNGFNSESEAVYFCKCRGFGISNGNMEYRMNNPKNGWQASEVMSIEYISDYD